jgi:hypothetical protein
VPTQNLVKPYPNLNKNKFDCSKIRKENPQRH